MIAKRISHRGVASLGQFSELGLRILTNASPQTEIHRVLITNCHSSDPTWAVKEIEATQALARPGRANKSYYLVVSFRQNERPDALQLHEIEDVLLSAIGLADHQRMSALHDDGQRLCLHIAVSRVHAATLRTIAPAFDQRRLMAACAELEARIGLIPDHYSNIVSVHPRGATS
ncbi:relaxase/mobilization nuclease domain-containing protein [Belnapia rosea]|uniref:relaxase/mobilization nuclease domain-containing protein n=1 Tax=Belnapia rosea TaxID=938405 RepID=UPI000B80D106|nr:relaxase/mobilization nuclease domain-containing protein [Belnapia rosea]